MTDLSPTEREALKQLLVTRWCEKHPGQCCVMFQRGAETFIWPCDGLRVEYHEPRSDNERPFGK